MDNFDDNVRIPEIFLQQINTGNLQFSDIKSYLTDEAKAVFDIDDHAQIGAVQYTMANYFVLIEGIIDMMSPKKICEIGVGAGLNTKLVLKICKKFSSRAHCIDPTIDRNALPVIDKELEYFYETSEEYFKREISHDIYFVDGEHTYQALYFELNAIASITKKNKHVIFTHDMSWPHAYRDVIYNPNTYKYKERKIRKGFVFPTSKGFTNLGLAMFYAPMPFEGGGGEWTT